MACYAIGIPQILSIVTVALALIAFILQIHQERANGTIDTVDHILTAGMSANVLSFIIVWFIPGSPANVGGWSTVYALETFVAFMLQFTFLIMEAGRLNIAGIQAGTPVLGQGIAAVVLIALNCPMLFYCAIHQHIDVILNLKNNLKRFLCTACFILTVLVMVCWLESGVAPVQPKDFWFHGIIIAASVAAALACIDGLFIAENGEEEIEGLHFHLNCMIGSILSAVFFIGASVDIMPGSQNPVLLVAIIGAAVNCMILFFMGQEGYKKDNNLWKQPLLSKLLIIIAVFTVVQYAIAMGVPQTNVGIALGAGGGLTWQHSVLSLGAGSVFIAIFFGYVYFDHNTRGVHIFIAFASYLAFFIGDAVESATYTASVGIWDDATNKAYRARICALVFGGFLAGLLLFATVLTFPTHKTLAERKGKVADETAETPASDTESE